MSYITANAAPVSEARLCLPGTGAWHVDLLSPSADAITGACDIDLGGALTLKGTVLTGGVYVESLHLRVVAGKGGWSTPCTAKYYAGASIGTILRDVLGMGGESLSAASDASVLAVVPAAFPTTTGTVGANVRALMNYAPAGTSWRFLPDGSFWVGPETWPAFGEDYQVMSEEPRERRVDVGFDVPTLLPGQTVVANAGDVLKVNHVETYVSTKVMQARAWWQS